MSRKKTGHEEHENHERWLVSYADFITLLFAFFVVLYATSSQNTEKEKKFEESIREEFKIPKGAGQGGPQGAAQGAANGQQQATPPELDIDPSALINRSRVANEDLQESIEALLEKSLSAEERKKSINDIRHDSVGVRISLAAATFFPSGSAKLRLPALNSLDKVAQVIKKSNRRILVEGHTDDIRVSGGQFDSNWELASLRATTVVRYLIKVQQFDPRKLAAISYADQKPIVPNDSEENRSRNRRIELLIVNNDTN